MGRIASIAALVTLMTGLLVGTAQAADNYQIDGVHSSMVFKVRHTGISDVYGRFNAFGGQFSLDAADPAKSTFSMEIKAESIDTNQAKRDEHLRGPDFFNVKQFPTITFKSTAVTVTGDDYSVVGDLTLHGVTKSITVPMKKIGQVTDKSGKTKVGFEAAFTVKRSAFDMNYGIEQGALSDEIAVMIGFQGAKQ